MQRRTCSFQVSKLFSKQLNTSRYGANFTTDDMTRSSIQLVGKGKNSRFELVNEKVEGKQWVNKEDIGVVSGELHSFYANLYNSSKHDHLMDASNTPMIDNIHHGTLH